jgi:hypothetical protein
LRADRLAYRWLGHLLRLRPRAHSKLKA